MCKVNESSRIAAYVHRLADWLDAHPDIVVIHVNAGSIRSLPRIHLTKPGLCTIATGLNVEMQGYLHWVHYYVTIDGIEFTACEQTQPERKTVRVEERATP